MFNKWQNGKFKRKGVSGEDWCDTEGMVSPTTRIDNCKGLTQRQEKEERMGKQKRENRKKGEPVICPFFLRRAVLDWHIPHPHIHQTPNVSQQSARTFQESVRLIVICKGLSTTAGKEQQIKERVLIHSWGTETPQGLILSTALASLLYSGDVPQAELYES